MAKPRRLYPKESKQIPKPDKSSTKNEARKQLDIASGLWHSIKSDLKEHMHKSYKIAPACATARHGTSI